jgi:membrane-associated phospholipid phosphatase
MRVMPEFADRRDRRAAPEGPLKKLEAAVGATLVIALVASTPCRAQDATPIRDSAAALQEPAPVQEEPSQEPQLQPRDFDTRNFLDVPEDRRTMAAFPKNLGRNFVGVFSGRNLFPFAIGLSATTLASAFDGHTEQALKGVCSVCGHTGAKMGGAAMLPMVSALFVAGRFAPEGKFKAMTYDFAQAMVVNGAYTGLLKYTVKRERPDGSDSLSFPSGHSSTAFSLATVATSHYGWKVGVPAYALASCIGLTRIEQDRHHLSDVIAGATLGLVVGRTVSRLDSQVPGRKRLVSIAPATDANGQGVGLSLNASW